MAQVTVVGSANIDIGGTPYGKAMARDSNPGRISLSVGGVGGNIARNLSLMGSRVNFITALGGDLFSGAIRSQFERDGVDLSHSHFDPDSSSSAYMFITDVDGDMLAAVSDMESSYVLTPQFLESRLEVINGSDALVMDANLPEDSIKFLAERVTVPIFCDTVSAAKAHKLLPVLGRLTALKPNRLEAELLTGSPAQTREELDAAAEKLLSTGLGSVFITLGSQGVYCRSRDRVVTLPVLNTPVVNTTGAGDSFTAGLVTAWLEGLDLEQAGRFALAASAITTASDQTVAPEMSRESIAKLLNSSKI